MAAIIKKRSLHAACAIFLLTLGACGGGAAKPPSNSDNNPQNPPPNQMSQESLDEAGGALGLIGTLDGAASSDLTRQEVTAELQTVAEMVTASPGTQAFMQTVFFCGSPQAGGVDSGNGNITTRNNDVDPQGPSAGDTVTVTFNACRQFGRTLNGTRTFTRNFLTGTFGTPPWTLDVTRTVDETITSPARSFTLEGSSKVVLGTGDGLIFSRVITGDSRQTSTSLINGAPVIRERSFVITTTRDLNSQTYATNADITSKGPNGTNKIETTTPLVGPLTLLSPPTGGVIKIAYTSAATPPSRSTTIVTVLAGGQAQVQADDDGDGTFDSTTTVTWSSLIGLGLNFFNT